MKSLGGLYLEGFYMEGLIFGILRYFSQNWGVKIKCDFLGALVLVMYKYKYKKHLFLALHRET